MSDREKLDLIDKMISDFIDMQTEAERNKNAFGLISAIISVLDFVPEEN